MSNFKYEKDQLLEETNGGLDIIRRLYPECEKGNKFVHFKLREEDTASANVFKHQDLYLVKDHGDTAKALNAIDLVMQKEGISFADACKWVAQEFQINGNTPAFNKADFEMIKATEDQKPGDCYFEYKDFTEKELEVLGPLVTVEVCEKFNLRSCKSVTRIKQYEDHPQYGNEVMQVVIKSNDRFPIYVYDFGTWQKIYQPFAKKNKNNPKSKDHRFSHAGDKPSDYIFGLEDLQERFEDFAASYDGEEKDPRLETVIIASGDRDGLNVASLNYPVIWLNSETATLEYYTYYKLTEYCQNVYYIGDIDPTGKRVSKERALKFLDMKIVWLPEWLRQGTYHDKPRKDFTDFMKLTWQKNQDAEKLSRDVRSLLSDALPARFWDYNTKSKQPYSVNNEALYRFLGYNGFYRFEEETAKEDFSFIYIKNGIVDRVKPHHLSNFPGEWLRKKRKPIALLNATHRSSQLSEKSLSKLDQKKINFKDCSYKHQLLFFRNKIWKVTKEGISEFDYADGNDIYVWKDKIITHDVKLQKSPSFRITHDGNRYDIEILNKDNHFLNYLINTSRVHWRKCGDAPFKLKLNALNDEDQQQYQKAATAIEKARLAYREENKFNIAEAGLTEEEIQEQKDHLINKIFAYGYLLHKNKVEHKAWCVLAMDHRISDIADSNGGSGKSIMLNMAVRHILLNHIYKDGRDPEQWKNKHIYDGVDQHTDYVIFDDADSRFPYTGMFTQVTGDLVVNPKHGKQYTVPFSQSPKFAITSNFGLFKPDGSTLRRILYTVFSDYYHYKSDDDATEWTPVNDFGKTLFSQFDETEWNDFFNVSAQALQFFLREETAKINPPLGNVEKRNSLQTMGDGFKEWADSYFTLENLNSLVVKTEASRDFEEKSKLKGWTSQRWKKSLNEWCKYYGYQLNPPETLNTQGHCKHSHNGTTVEMVFIKTGPTERLQQQIKAAQENNEFDIDDLAF